MSTGMKKRLTQGILLSLLASPVFASEQQVSQAQSTTQQNQTLKANAPLAKEIESTASTVKPQTQSGYAQLSQLLSEGKTKEAYTLATNLRAAEEGNPDFDFFYGLAAVNTQHPDEALFAFERITLIHPTDVRAHLELARVYYLLGEYDLAKREFLDILKINPPENVRANIVIFLAAIETRASVTKTKKRYYVSFGGGYDDNVNSATASQFITLANVLQVQLDIDSRKMGDGFYQIAAGASGIWPCTNNISLFGKADIQRKDNFSSDKFDTTVGELEGGPSYSIGKYVFRFPMRYQQLQLDWSTLRRIYGAELDVSREINTQNRLTLFAGGAGFIYPKQTSLDVNSSLGGVGWAYQTADAKTEIAGNIYIGDNHPRQDHSDFNGNLFYGAQLNITQKLTARQQLSAGITRQHTRYNSVQLLLGERRRDNFWGFSGAWALNVVPKWTLTASATYIKNHSLELYRYDRMMLLLDLKRVFGN